MPDPEETDSEAGQSAARASPSVDLIGYIAPPYEPMLVERKTEVVELNLKVAEKNEKCLTVTKTATTSANQKQTSRS